MLFRSQKISVEVKGDLKAEAHEQFEVALGQISAGVDIPPINIVGNPQIGTITNDDGAVIFLDVGSDMISEFEQTKAVSITLSTVTDGNVSVNYEVVPGTATDGEDFTIVNGTVTFASGELVKVVEIPILDDDVLEQPESFTVTLSNPSRFELGNPSSGVITILDDDSFPIVDLASSVEIGRAHV